MAHSPEEPATVDGTRDPAETAPAGRPILAEDLLLLLFQPRFGTFAGETTLYYILAAAVLADLALGERVRVETTPTGTVRVGAVAGHAPADEILRTTWDYLADRPRFVQTVLPTIGPQLRQPTIARLIARGDIGRESRKALGLFRRTVLVAGENGRRSELVAGVRAVLVDGAEPEPRVAALAALTWASGSLPQLDPEIPWTSAVTTRAQELERGSWGAAAGGEAVVRTMNAIIMNSVIVANAALRRS